MVARINLLGINQANCPGIDNVFTCDEPVSQFHIDVAGTAPPKPKYVHFYNLCDERVEVIRLLDDKCFNAYEAPWLCNGCPVVISESNPEVILTVPGRYVFRTASGNPYDFDSVGVERDTIDVEFARLRLEQHSLCCCNQRV